MVIPLSESWLVPETLTKDKRPMTIDQRLFPKPPSRRSLDKVGYSCFFIQSS